MNKNHKKVRRVGRPKLPKGHVHARIVPMRVRDDDYKLFVKAAKENNQTLSEWIRATLRDAV